MARRADEGARRLTAAQTIFHITTRSAWEAAARAGEYAADSLPTEGFIHCSERHQVLPVANRLFKGRSHLVVLHIDTGMVPAEIRRENLEGGTEMFPHVYGPVPAAAVVTTTPLVADADGTYRTL